jgi:glutamyl-Q tRNA(Asp) synthetase
MTPATEPGTDNKPLAYRGRFAPTPSGPLHFGSLVAAMASYLDARHQGGEWLVRMEDLDPPREVRGAADAILRALDVFGFEWDGPILYQHTRREAYRAALDELGRLGLTYGCNCSRKRLSAVAQRGIDGPVYPGTCRRRPPGEHLAVRLRVPREQVQFQDRLQGLVSCNLPEECGDFVLRRADGVHAYQLAVVVDDAAQGVTHIVRGADLLTSSPRQIALQRYLQCPTPSYLHLPIALDSEGHKLSKQTLATPLDPKQPLPGLMAALEFLGMPCPADIAARQDFWDWAVHCWPLRQLPPIRGRRMPASLCNP